MPSGDVTGGGDRYSCTFPKARFTTSFFACRIINDERHHVLNEQYVVRSGHGVEASTTSTTIADKAELLALMRDVFGVELSEDETHGIERYLK